MCVGDRSASVSSGVARLRDGERAARRGAALLDDVGELVRDQLVARREPGLYSPAREVDVSAGRERARGDRAVEPVGRLVGVHADVGEVAERAGEAVLDAAVEARAAAARAVDRGLHGRVDLAAGQDPVDLARERAVADVGDELA